MINPFGAGECLPDRRPVPPERGAPPTAEAAEALFLAHLPALDRIVGVICARNGVRGADAEDFGGWVRMRIVEDDYAILRKFAGRSSLATYLSVVIANLYRDYRVRRDGRWRPSAAARRLGPAAERLERLIYRDRRSFRDAVATLRSRGATTASDRELADLLGRLPVRTLPRPEPAGDAPLASIPAEEGADTGVVADEERQERERVRRALTDALESLPAEDRLMLKMRFWDEMSVADIARALHLDQKPLYRRIERSLLRVREALLADGVGSDALGSFMGDVRDDARDFPGSHPSIEAE